MPEISEVRLQQLAHAVRMLAHGMVLAQGPTYEEISELAKRVLSAEFLVRDREATIRDLARELKEMLPYGCRCLWLR